MNLLFVASCSAQSCFIKPDYYTYKVVRTYPHDPAVFTQGLVYSEGLMYESSGLNGRSFFKQFDLETGNIMKLQRLPDDIFAEGLALTKDRLILLSYKSGKGFFYARETFTLQSEFQYSTEGWGLTFDGTHLIMSDGSAQLVYLDAQSGQAIKSIQVKEGSMKIENLNELEYFKNSIYANIWQTERIVRIHPVTGCVSAWIDLQGLTRYLGPYRQIDVLNGIAYDQQKNRIFVTGKFWPKLFEIKLVQQKNTH